MGLSKESPISTDLSLLYSKCTFKTTFHALQKSSKDSFFHLPVQSEENSDTEQCKIPKCIKIKTAKNLSYTVHYAYNFTFTVCNVAKVDPHPNKT